MTRFKSFRARYGAGPLHLLALLASFAIAGAAVLGWFQRAYVSVSYTHLTLPTKRIV